MSTTDGHDLGACWLYGTDDNPLAERLRAAEVATHVGDFDDFLVFDADGEPLDEDELESVGNAYMDLLEHVAEGAEELDADITLDEALEAVLAAEELELDEDAQRALSWCISSHEIEAGGASDELGIFGLDEGEELEGDNIGVVGGLGKLVDILSKDLVGVDIQLGTPVKRIEWSGEQANVEARTGERWAGDAVLVTLPVSVLQTGDVAFAPPLPNDKLAAIAAIGTGVTNRVVLRFKSQFWPSDHAFVGFMAERPGRWPEFVNITPTSATPASTDPTGKTRPGATLVALCGGRYAVAMESKTDAEVVADIMDVLTTMFGDAAQAPTEVTISRWLSDEFARGAYSFLPVGVAGAHRQVLAAPVGDRLRFAGEATHSAYPATVHGAWMSGVREAKALLQRWETNR